jgi:hypothetical protein
MAISEPKGENQGDVVPDQKECIPLKTPEAGM